MKLDYVPLLRVQRELQGLPRNYDRFRLYLRTVLTKDGKGLELPPLIAMNPMGKEHVTDLLDALLALDADGVASRTLGFTPRGLSPWAGLALALHDARAND